MASRIAWKVLLAFAVAACSRVDLASGDRSSSRSAAELPSPNDSDAREEAEGTARNEVVRDDPQPSDDADDDDDDQGDQVEDPTTTTLPSSPTETTSTTMPPQACS